MFRSGVGDDLVILPGERDIPEFVGNTASDDDALGPGLVSRRAHLDGMFSGYDSGDVIALVETIQVLSRNLDAIYLDAYFHRIGLKSDRPSVDENSTFEIETVPESVEKDAPRDDAEREYGEEKKRETWLSLEHSDRTVRGIMSGGCRIVS